MASLDLPLREKNKGMHHGIFYDPVTRADPREAPIRMSSELALPGRRPGRMHSRPAQSVDGSKRSAQQQVLVFPLHHALALRVIGFDLHDPGGQDTGERARLRWRSCSVGRCRFRCPRSAAAEPRQGIRAAPTFRPAGLRSSGRDHPGHDEP